MMRKNNLKSFRVFCVALGHLFFVGMLVKFNCMIVNASANIFLTDAFYWLLSCLRILMIIKR